jgi:hypothetical protein
VNEFVVEVKDYGVLVVLGQEIADEIDCDV